MSRHRPGSAEGNAAEHTRRYMVAGGLTISAMVTRLNGTAGAPAWSELSFGRFRRGERLLGFGEAVTLARALGITLEQLACPPEYGLTKRQALAELLGQRIDE